MYPRELCVDNPKLSPGQIMSVIKELRIRPRHLDRESREDRRYRRSQEFARASSSSYGPGSDDCLPLLSIGVFYFVDSSILVSYVILSPIFNLNLIRFSQ